MNPYGEVGAENTNGIVTVNGHSYADKALRTENTNFALLCFNRFTEPLRTAMPIGESIATGAICLEEACCSSVSEIW